MSGHVFTDEELFRRLFGYWPSNRSVNWTALLAEASAYLRKSGPHNSKEEA